MEQTKAEEKCNFFYESAKLWNIRQTFNGMAEDGRKIIYISKELQWHLNFSSSRFSVTVSVLRRLDRFHNFPGDDVKKKKKKERRFI